VLDFSSALYLGMTHGSGTLPQWTSLTLGKPAALQEPPGARGLATRLAALTGCRRGLLFPSTLHLFVDLFTAFAPADVFVDSGAYALARQGVDCAASRGGSQRTFEHHDAESLERALRNAQRRALVVCDGFCVGCGAPAPLADYYALVRATGGLLVVDDTQGLGVLGAGARTHDFGRGGGGSLAYAGVFGSGVVYTASLAKAFGVPVALAAGADTVLRRLEERASSRAHSSPPSAAAIAAAERALDDNAEHGDALRAGLLSRVSHLTRGLRALGIATTGRPFPALTLAWPRGRAALELHARLSGLGVELVLTRPSCRARDLALAWLVSVRQSSAEIDSALQRLEQALDQRSSRSLVNARLHERN